MFDSHSRHGTTTPYSSPWGTDFNNYRLFGLSPLAAASAENE